MRIADKTVGRDYRRRALSEHERFTVVLPAPLLSRSSNEPNDLPLDPASLGLARATHAKPINV